MLLLFLRVGVEKILYAKFFDSFILVLISVRSICSTYVILDVIFSFVAIYRITSSPPTVIALILVALAMFIMSLANLFFYLKSFKS